MSELQMVAWTEPDHDRQRVAHEKLEAALRAHSPEALALRAELTRCDQHFPDLNAQTTYTGLLLSVVFVPGQKAALMSPQGRTSVVELSKPHWVALVAIDDRVIEIDPLRLGLKRPYDD